MMQIYDQLSKYLIFHDLDDDYMQLLADNAVLEYHAPGDQLFRKAEPADSLYIVTKGEVELLEEDSDQGHTLPVQVVKEGELLGWSWLMPAGHWNYYGKALSSVDVIKFNAGPIRECIANDHEFGYQMYKRLYYTVVERLFNTRYYIYEKLAEKDTS